MNCLLSSSQSIYTFCLITVLILTPLMKVVISNDNLMLSFFILWNTLMWNGPFMPGGEDQCVEWVVHVWKGRPVCGWEDLCVE